MKNKLSFLLLVVAIMSILAMATNAKNTSVVSLENDVGVATVTATSTTAISTDLENAAPAAAVDIGLVNRFTNSMSSSMKVTVNTLDALAPDEGLINSLNLTISSTAVNKTVTDGGNMARDVGLANSFNNSTTSTKAINATTDVDIGSIVVSISS